ncbi:hypothetical protein [Rhodopseudomonas sp. RCAM05734]
MSLRACGLLACCRSPAYRRAHAGELLWPSRGGGCAAARLWVLCKFEPVGPQGRPNSMKNWICILWNKVADWIDAAIEFYDWMDDKPGPNNRFARPDKILASPTKRDR